MLQLGYLDPYRSWLVGWKNPLPNKDWLVGWLVGCHLDFLLFRFFCFKGFVIKACFFVV